MCCVTLTRSFPLPHPSSLSSLNLQGSGKDPSQHSVSQGTGSIHPRGVVPFLPSRLHPRTLGPQLGVPRPLLCPYPPLEDPKQPHGFSYHLYCDCHIRAPALLPSSPFTPPSQFLTFLQLDQTKTKPPSLSISPWSHHSLQSLGQNLSSQIIWLLCPSSPTTSSSGASPGSVPPEHSCVHPSLAATLQTWAHHLPQMALTSFLLHSSPSYSHTPGSLSR